MALNIKLTSFQTVFHVYIQIEYIDNIHLYKGDHPLDTFNKQC